MSSQLQLPAPAGWAATVPGKENFEGSGGQKWAGHESTERLLRDIHSRYTEAQQILRQQAGCGGPSGLAPGEHLEAL